ncbi:TIGR03915 family putative DNA repair protein [Pseudobacteroides cellulosolvens]|uniref:Putative DNA metabolism protein n=1 Tax=Pseudobacteroides cellulosolvens ATCC 35603 = DSM 2933 TaxID=398512 RepID=A0A0L6JRL1_9FIRM|nr:TIGR03915 family putative DNA repair protein [Pseudobacteroides cellulosolvens]KNY28404.1 putative DNA metabolism protein [Pseudobacteroides cellulosolvens ATCC 35603 = DSM 2933]
MNDQMISYTYDGSFEGLLSAIYESYYRHEIPLNILPEESSQMGIFTKDYNVKTNIEKFHKVYNSVREKISPLALRNIYYVFISDSKNKELIIYKYLKLGWKFGGDIDRLITDESVLNVRIISRKVTSECHRFLGLVRFKLMEGDYYYASLEPDYNIISLLALHFSKRLSDQRWVIHDLKRKLAVVYDKEGWFLTAIEQPLGSHLSAEKEDFQTLWKLYFKNISIKNRKNPRLQKQFMPVRYWAHLVEME